MAKKKARKARTWRVWAAEREDEIDLSTLHDWAQGVRNMLASRGQINYRVIPVRITEILPKKRRKKR